MRFNITPLLRGVFASRACRAVYADGELALRVQVGELRRNLAWCADTEFGRRYDFASLAKADDCELLRRYRLAVPVCDYESLRGLVMRMIEGEGDLLWRGVCRRYAQSSGTSGGQSKFIPVTDDSLRLNHYGGARDAVSFYLSLVPESRLFAGRALILGGSFDNTLGRSFDGVKVGDLSANLIDAAGCGVDLFRVPDRRTALLGDWSRKLPLIAEAAARRSVTNVSGVPSWMLTVLRMVLSRSGCSGLSDVWPDLEVFFHGGISFDPYRSQYAEICNQPQMRYIENYNASEGFFAVQNDFDDSSMLLLLDRGVFYEFLPLDDVGLEPVSVEQVECGRTYSLIISSCNGLWRYAIGDTVQVVSVNPVKIRIAGRTQAFINAFGEELMQHNTDTAIARACSVCGCSVSNYTVAPVFSEQGRRGCHQWLIEWHRLPDDLEVFRRCLDAELCELNSDYAAKRKGTIFLDPPLIVSAREGLFDEWLGSTGSGKLGGQRKIPRLSPNRKIMDSLLAISS